MPCKVPRCPAGASGQIVVCTPHWTLLPLALRKELIEAERVIDGQRAVGNVRRADRDALRVLSARALAELEAERVELSAFAGRDLPADGALLMRERRRAADEQLAADVGLLLEREGEAGREILSQWTRS